MDDIPVIIGILLSVVLGGAIIALIVKTIRDRIIRNRAINNQKKDESKEDKK
ncbi:MAG: hypothetical protein MJ214_00465 [Bacilli bacterium]|nr:hypothetical protein [Bacilli bacterium]